MNYCCFPFVLEFMATVTTQLPYAACIQHRTEDTRTYLLQASGSDQRPVIKIRVCAIVQRTNTTARPTTKMWSRTTLRIRICSCMKANKMADSCASKLRREFCSFVKRLLYEPPCFNSIFCSAEATRRSSWLIPYHMEN